MSAESPQQLFVGQIVHSKSLDELEIFTNGFVAVRDGIIAHVADVGQLDDWLLSNASFANIERTQLTESQFLLPGLIDCHIHAPQMPNIGLGLDRELLDWLDEYTFPTEAQYTDLDYARRVYAQVVRRTLHSGTTLASYFATNDRASSLILAEEALRQGQRAFVGKVSSNCCCPSFYVETTGESLTENAAFIDGMKQLTQGIENPLVRATITPRFAVSCDAELLRGLGQLAAQHQLHVQTHISESLGEIAVVRRDHGSGYAQTYDAAGLLTARTILAHGVHLTDDELALLRERRTSIAHCPSSNTMLRSGLCDVRRLLRAGIDVGLGTDVSGGCRASVLCAVKDAIEVSLCLDTVKKQAILGTGRIATGDDEQQRANAEYVPLTYRHGLYLATLGGARALAIEDTVGNFVAGKAFDALLVNVDAGSVDRYPETERDRSKSAEQRLLELVQRFVFVGDDRNVQQVYVNGRQVKV